MNSAAGGALGHTLVVPADVEAEFRQRCVDEGMGVARLQRELSRELGVWVSDMAAELLHEDYAGGGW